MAASLVVASGVFTSCDDDDYNTSQIKGGVSLTAAQLQVTRGAYMQFKGSGLEQITNVIFPVEVSSTPEVLDKYTIRCLVPEEATVGTVRLIYSGGELETSEPIAFTEPVEISDYTKVGKAGDVFTVTGRYLEYFTHARFATGEAVKLQSISRNEVKVSVPVDASTGEMVLLYYTEVNGEQIATEQPVGEVTLAQPAVAEVATVKDIYPGDVVTIKGTDLNLVEFLTLPGGIKVTSFDVSPTQISFAAPAAMQAGVVVSTSYAGIATDLINVAPKAATVEALVNAADAELGNKVKNGTKLIIKGADLDLVARVEFDGADAVEEFEVNEAGTELTLVLPIMAKSGEVKVITKSEVVATTTLETIKPISAAVSAWPLPAGSEITYTGENFDLIKSLTLPSGEVLTEFKNHTATEFTVLFPHTASGSNFSTVEMINGEVVADFQWVEIQAVTYCYPLEVAKSYQAGNVGAIVVANLDKLTAVKLDGKEVTYIKYDDATLYIPMTYANVGTKKVELISGDQSYEFEVKIIAGEVEEVLYETPIELVAWENHETMIDFSSVPEGAMIRLHYTITGEDPAIQIYNGHWEMAWAAKADGNDEQVANLNNLKENDYVDLDPALFPYSDWGYSIILQGQGIIISSVSWVKNFGGAAEKTIWEGSVTLSWSDDAGKILNFNAYDFRECKAGSILKFYYEAAEGGMMQFNNANWSNILGADVTIPMAEGSEYELELTQEILDSMINDQPSWAGDNVYFFNLQGSAATLTKITIIEK